MANTAFVVRDFGMRTIDFVCAGLQADWGCFYLLDEEAQPHTFCAHGVPAEMPQGYIETDMAQCDPLHPRYLTPQDTRCFSLLDDPALNAPPERLRRYWKFLNGFGVRHTGEMVFRHQGRPIAGLSLMWRGSSPAPRGAGFGLAMHSYIEYAVGAQCGAALVTESPSLGVELTRREWQVAQLACSGCSNADIADRLTIGVATVKTHLLNIFGKLGVTNRTALVRRMLATAEQ